MRTRANAIPTRAHGILADENAIPSGAQAVLRRAQAMRAGAKTIPRRRKVILTTGNDVPGRGNVIPLPRAVLTCMVSTISMMTKILLSTFLVTAAALTASGQGMIQSDRAGGAASKGTAEGD